MGSRPDVSGGLPPGALCAAVHDRRALADAHDVVRSQHRQPEQRNTSLRVPPRDDTNKSRATELRKGKGLGAISESPQPLGMTVVLT